MSGKHTEPVHRRLVGSLVIGETPAGLSKAECEAECARLIERITAATRKLAARPDRLFDLETLAFVAAGLARD
jgi:hypothetical protein